MANRLKKTAAIAGATLAIPAMAWARPAHEPPTQYEKVTVANKCAKQFLAKEVESGDEECIAVQNILADTPVRAHADPIEVAGQAIEAGSMSEDDRIALGILLGLAAGTAVAVCYNPGSKTTMQAEQPPQSPADYQW